MLKVLVRVTALFLGLCCLAHAQSFIPTISPIQSSAASCSPTSASTACVFSQPQVGTGTVDVVVTGTWSATLQFEASYDLGVTWAGLQCNPVPTGAAVTSTAANGSWECAASGVTYARVRASAYASGTPLVTLLPSPTVTDDGPIQVVPTTGQPLVVTSTGPAGSGTSTAYSCTITLSTATTTQCQAAPAAGLRNYVQNYQLVTTTAGTASTVGLVYGTGASCGTGTTALTPVYPNTTLTPANSNGTLVNLSGAGLVPPLVNAICAVQTATAGTTVVTVTGVIAP